MLRVAVLANRLPYVLVNRERNLVGFDIEMAQLLERDFSDAPRYEIEIPSHCCYWTKVQYTRLQYFDN